MSEVLRDRAVQVVPWGEQAAADDHPDSTKCEKPEHIREERQQAQRHLGFRAAAPLPEGGRPKRVSGERVGGRE